VVFTQNHLLHSPNFILQKRNGRAGVTLLPETLNQESPVSKNKTIKAHQNTSDMLDIVLF